MEKMYQVSLSLEELCILECALSQYVNFLHDRKMKEPAGSDYFASLTYLEGSSLSLYRRFESLEG